MAKLTQAQKEAFRNARADLATLETRVFFSRSVGMMLAAGMHFRRFMMKMKMVILFTEFRFILIPKTVLPMQKIN